MSLPVSSLALPALLLASLAAAPASAARHHLEPPAPRAPVPETFPDLTGYHVVTVADLDASALRDDAAHQEIARKLADSIALSLAERPDLGFEVRRGVPLGRPDELVVGGSVVKARKGSRTGRYFVGPLAAARLAADLTVTDASTGKQLASGRLQKTWGMPGIAGAVQGMNSVVKRAGERVADYFEGARGQAQLAIVPAVGQ